MAVQTAYLDNMPVAFHGMVANMEQADLISRTLEGATLGFGEMVKQGTQDYGVVVVGAAADQPVGVSVRINDVEQDSYVLNDNVLLLRKGVVALTVAENVTAGANVFYDAVADTWHDTDTANRFRVVNARFETSASTGQLAMVRFDGMEIAAT
jgi:hypothetical protein